MDLATLADKLTVCLQADRQQLTRRLQQLKKQSQPTQQSIVKLQQQIERSAQVVQQRHQQRPKVSFPDQLPINAKREEIMQAIDQHQVIILCGETGSGKSTQLPKICLDMGRGTRGLIGHTQPRRIAARTVAARVAEELHVNLGEQVGYKIRFTDKVQSKSYIKVMTDGILLAETQGDRFLDAYDTLIIDEAHERSLNIDFLIGYLKTLLPKRPDLKIIITSATIDPERFSRHFDDAPIIEVSGRTYPVELRYRPLSEDQQEESEKSLAEAILEAINELSRLDHGNISGDILIFLSGERDLREISDFLAKQRLKNTEILSLYAKQGSAEQNRIFQPHNKRHIILSTNVAETSLTVPGIRYVIDPGFARISRYNPRSKVQRLPIESISQASANQRMGRCGRVSEGICIRLYSEEDFKARPEFTDAEIRRTNLASVILQLASLHFADVENFPFVDPPEGRYINDGYKLLEELGAVDQHRKLTSIGKKLAKLPVDPRIGRIVLAAADHHCLKEILIIASALSVQDVRDKPMDKMQQAEEQHKQFADEDSDFIWFVNLWQFYRQQQQQLSQNKLRKLCRTNFLNYLRMREWHDIHTQLKGLVKDLGFSINSEAAQPDAIHRSLLTGLLGNIGFLADRKEYNGTRGIKFFLFPGSGQFKKSPKWVMSMELVETSKLYARINAKIDPLWVIKIAADRVKRSYSDAFWSNKAGSVMALEKVMLYGLTLSSGRKINYSKIDPIESRRLFIQGALVAGDTREKFDFLSHNQKLLREVEDLEHRSRRMDILIDAQLQFEFYESRLPDQINNIHELNKWWKETKKLEPDRLNFERDFLIKEDSTAICDQALPTSLSVAGMDLPLSYHFKPGDENDGITLSVPVAILKQLNAQRFDWLVPGLIEEKVTQLIRLLPKSLRRNFVPAPNFAQACIQAIDYAQGNLFSAISAHLFKVTNVEVPLSAWAPDRLAEHLRMNFRVMDVQGKIIDQGRDLDRLQGKLQGEVEQIFNEETHWSIEQDDLSRWDFADLPETVETSKHGMPLRGYPALFDHGDTVSIRVQDSAEKAGQLHRCGLRRLIQLSLPEQIKYLDKNLANFNAIGMLYLSLGKASELKTELIATIIDRAFLGETDLPRKQLDFQQCLERGRSELIPIANQLCAQVEQVLSSYAEVNKAIKRNNSLALLQCIKAIKQQITDLVYPGFIFQTPAHWLQHLPRYLKAIERRLEKCQRDPKKDQQIQSRLQLFHQRLNDKNNLSATGIEYRWMLEELHVSLFAQDLGTAYPVSEKRLEKLWQRIKDEG